MAYGAKENLDVYTKHGFSAFAIKWIAALSLVIGYVGMVFFPAQLWLQWLGSLAFPMFCFLVTIGFFRTKSRLGYAMRLFLAAVCSQFSYGLLLWWTEHRNLSGFWENFLVVFGKQNFLFSLGLGLCSLWIVDYLRSRYHLIGHALGIGFTFLFIGIGYVFHVEYYLLGVPLVIGCYEVHVFRTSRFCLATWIGDCAKIVLPGAVLLHYAFYESILLRKTSILEAVIFFGFRLVAVVLLYFYTGKKGYQSKFLQYFFYACYPILLLLLLLFYGIFCA